MAAAVITTTTTTSTTLPERLAAYLEANDEDMPWDQVSFSSALESFMGAHAQRIAHQCCHPHDIPLEVYSLYQDFLVVIESNLQGEESEV